MQSFAQTSYFKFPITEEGVYKITAPQASQMGSSISQLRLFGQHGVIPSQLDSSFNSLHELPTWENNGELFFYASGPHFHQADLSYHHHPYSDTLYYIIETGRGNGKTIQNQAAVPSGSGETALYKLLTKKEETHNLLNSGRQWWGNRSLNGQVQNLFFPANTTDFPFYYDFRVLGQSTGTNGFTFRLNDEEIEQVNIEAIPNATYGVKGRTAKVQGFHRFNSSSGVKASFQYQSSNPNGMGYLDYLTIGYPEKISNNSSGVYHLIDQKTIHIPSIDKIVWAIDLEDNIRQLTQGTHQLETPKIAIFSPGDAKPVSNFSPIELNLRDETSGSTMLIITVPLLRNQAQRLADHRSSQGIKTSVVTLEAIYNSWGYGNRDVSAIRNFLANEYQQGGQLQHVLFFGKGTFDYKGIVGGRPNLVPTFTSTESLNPLATFSSDDFFAQLESESENLQIGVGRLPAINVQEAVNMVDKLIAYDDAERNLGEWKRKVLLFADDGDNHLHLNDSERHAAYLHENHPELKLHKLYLDSFEKDTKNNRYPAAAKALLEQVREGVLLINYVGHGNEEVLTAEQVFHVSQLENWPIQTNLPILVTATCEFGRQDSPFLRSGAEEMLLQPNKGAIALLTTGRPVFSSSNYAINRAFMETAFARPLGENRTLGEIYKETKNKASGNANNQSFSLIGDPSMRLAMPELNTSKPEFSISELQVDTLRSLESILISAEIIDPLTGSHLSNFEGNFSISLYSAAKSKETLGNIEAPTNFLNENQTLYTGEGKIENGVIKAEFLFPKLSEDLIKGSLKIFAEDKKGQTSWGATKVALQNQPPPLEDLQGPKIRLSLNDPEKHQAVISSTQAPLFIFLEDESGIYISQENQAWQPQLSINGGELTSLASSYRAMDNGYQKGGIVTVIENLKEGPNTIEFQVHDNQGNLSSQTLEFRVEGSRELRILSQKVYPNPASSQTKFRLQHNRPGQDLIVDVRVFNLMGAEIFTYSKRYPHANAELEDLEWIFLHTKTKYPAKGTYIYKLELRSEADGTSDSKSGKLIIQ